MDSDDKSIFAGRTFTGFSNEEEIQIGKVAVSIQNFEGIYSILTFHNQDIPFLLEDRIIELGGKYVKADKAWDVSHIGHQQSYQHSDAPLFLGESRS